MLLNGVRFTEKDFRAFGVYVMQAEPLLATATVNTLLPCCCWQPCSLLVCWTACAGHHWVPFETDLCYCVAAGQGNDRDERPAAPAAVGQPC